MATGGETKRYFLVAFVAVIATLSLALAIMRVTRDMSAQGTALVWALVIGVLVFVYFLARRATLRKRN